MNIYEPPEFVRMKNLNIAGFIEGLKREDRIYVQTNNNNFRSWLDDQIWSYVNSQRTDNIRPPFPTFSQNTSPTHQFPMYPIRGYSYNTYQRTGNYISHTPSHTNYPPAHRPPSIASQPRLYPSQIPTAPIATV
jgi:hypothetical protein